MTSHLAGIKFSSCVLLFSVLILAFTGGTLFAQKYDIKSADYTESTKLYEINISYPQMIAPGDALMGVRGMVGDFNLPIKAIVTRRVNEFKKDVKDFKLEGQKRKSTLGIGYDTFLDNKYIFSVKFSGYADPELAAHPIGLVDCVNFSYDRWDVFFISDIFLKDKPFIKYISDYCIKSLKDSAKDDNNVYDADIEKGASADSNNFKVFNITADSLVITFPFYQVGPRIIGAPVVPIPLNNMTDMIDPKGPLGYYLKK
jgi:hypothetical protein